MDAELGVPEVCRELVISTATFYKWRSKYGDMDISMMARMKELEAENARLKKMYIEEKLKGKMVTEALAKKVVRFSHRPEMAQRAVWDKTILIRFACEAFRVSEFCYRYEAKNNAENELIANWLIRLTDNNRNWGFGLCYLYLRKIKNFTWNHKRIYQI